MKTIFKIMAMLMLALSFGNCSDDDDTVQAPARLEVSNVTLAGYWQLAEIDGQSTAPGSYVYMEFVRRDQTFKIYENMGSMYATLKTGKFTYKTDAYGVTTLSGRYDSMLDDNKWAHDYIVESLLADGTLTLVVKEGEAAGETYLYKKVESIPADVIEGTTSL